MSALVLDTPNPHSLLSSGRVQSSDPGPHWIADQAGQEGWNAKLLKSRDLLASPQRVRRRVVEGEKRWIGVGVDGSES